MRTQTTLPAPETTDRGVPLKKRPNGSAGNDSTPKTSVLLAGFDWGTNKSCIHTCVPPSHETVVNTMVPTVVGYASEGIVEDLIPGNPRMLFGDDALKRRLHLRLVQPMVNGVIEDAAAARDFAVHIRLQLKAPDSADVRAVVGLPANADRASRDNLRQAVSGLFDKVILIPEPFLAALGYRDESRLSDPAYVDPVSNSMFVDIGAGTTDLCLVQGYYPAADDQLSIAFAGDKVDALFNEGIKRTYPDLALSMIKIREIKEQYSYVGKLENPIVLSLVVNGKMCKFDLGVQLGEACSELLKRILESVKLLIARASPDSVLELLQNIILTGGGSRVRNLAPELQRMLADEGYENPQVRTVGENYKEFVAKGALKAARQAKESQWQTLIA